MGKTKGLLDFTKTGRKKKKSSSPRSKYNSRRSSPTQGTSVANNNVSESENEDSVSIVLPSDFNNKNESESAFMGPTASTSADDDNNVPTSNAEIETNESTGYKKRSFIGKIREKISNETVVIRKERHDKKKEKDDRKKAKEEKKLAKKMKKKADKLERKKQEEEKAKEEEDKKKDQDNAVLTRAGQNQLPTKRVSNNLFSKALKFLQRSSENPKAMTEASALAERCITPTPSPSHPKETEPVAVTEKSITSPTTHLKVFFESESNAIDNENTTITTSKISQGGIWAPWIMVDDYDHMDAPPRIYYAFGNEVNVDSTPNLTSIDDTESVDLEFDEFVYYRIKNIL